MIEPISCNCKKPHLNFKGAANSNAEMPETLSTRGMYEKTVKDVSNIQSQFIAPNGVGNNLNVKG